MEVNRFFKRAVRREGKLVSDAVNGVELDGWNTICFHPNGAYTVHLEALE